MAHMRKTSSEVELPEIVQLEARFKPESLLKPEITLCPPCN